MIENDVLFIIRDKMPGMSKGYKKVAEYVLEHYDEAAFETAASVGKKIGVSESTVVRFAMAIGYAGYPEYQKALGNALRTRLASVKKLDEQYGHNTQAELIRRVVSADISKLQQTVEEIDPDRFEDVVTAIVDAENVYIVGPRGGRILAAALYNSLNLARRNVYLVDSDSEEEIVERLFRIGEKDCFIFLSFPKYSKRSTVAFEQACIHKAKTILITDEPKPALEIYAETTLYAKVETVSVVNSLVAPMSLINAIAVSVCVKNQEEVGNSVSEIQSFINEEQDWNHIEVSDEDYE